MIGLYLSLVMVSLNLPRLKSQDSWEQSILECIIHSEVSLIYQATLVIPTIVVYIHIFLYTPTILYERLTHD